MLWPGQYWKIHSEAQLGIVLLVMSVGGTNQKPPPPDRSASTRQRRKVPWLQEKLGSRLDIAGTLGAAGSPTLEKFPELSPVQ